MKNNITKIPSHYRQLRPDETIRKGDIYKSINGRIGPANSSIGSTSFSGDFYRRQHIAVKQSSNPSNFAKVKREVKRAYCESTRNLNFKASASVTIEEAVKIMAEALECKEDCEGYNNFKPSCFRYLPSGTKITLAREGSVCAYIKAPKGSFLFEAKLIRAMLIDEFDKDAAGTYRIWFD